MVIRSSVLSVFNSSTKDELLRQWAKNKGKLIG